MLPEAAPSNVLASAVSLYASGILWALVAGPGTFLTGLLTGAASIALGVWIGMAVAARIPPTPEPPEEEW